MSEFKITKPGLYRQRDGGVARVAGENPEAKEAQRWVGWSATHCVRSWFDNGRLLKSQAFDDDLIAEHREPASETALLSALESLTIYCERMNEVLAQECGVRFVDNAPLEEARSVLAKAKGVAS